MGGIRSVSRPLCPSGKPIKYQDQDQGSVSPDYMMCVLGPHNGSVPATFRGRPAGPAARRGPQGWGVRLGLVRVGLTVPPSPARDTATRSSPGVESESGKQWAGENLVTFFSKSYCHLLPPTAPRDEIFRKVGEM